MKIFFRRIHLYLSLAAGLVILVCCLTGAILVFEKDLQMALNRDRYFVEQGTGRLSIDQLAAGIRNSHPRFKINNVKVYADPTRSVEFGVSPKPDKSKGGNGVAAGGKEKGAAPRGRQPGFTLFVNPYSGKVLEQYSYRETFFYQVFALHRWLLGSEGSIGKYIVGVSTLVFLFILLTGIILWWPRTRKIMARRLTLRWDAGWKRLNHDMHLVFGFYSAIFLFIFAFTGLAWSFEWFNKGIYTVTASPMKPHAPPQSQYREVATIITFEQALAAGRTVYPEAEFYSLSLPADSVAPFTVSALPLHPAHESATNAVYLDQYSGAVLGSLPFAERSLGARTRSFFKPVHTGSLWGTPSKIVAFIVCLLGVTFPITGVILWINRTQKKKGVRPAGRTKALREEQTA